MSELTVRDENAVLKAFIALTFFPVSVTVSGVTLKYLWGWFVVPLGVKPIGIIWALGLSIIIGRFTGSGKASTDPLGKMIAINLGMNGFMLLLGYIYHLYM